VPLKIPLSTRLPEEAPLAKSDTHGRDFNCNFDRLAHGRGLRIRGSLPTASLPPPHPPPGGGADSSREQSSVRYQLWAFPRHGAEPFQQQLTFNSGAVRAGKRSDANLSLFMLLATGGKRLDDELLGSKAGQIQGPSSAVAMAFSPLPWCLVFLHSASRTRCSLLAARSSYTG